MNRISKKEPRGHILGVGLDNEDGHKRLTQSDQFTVVSGSEETHEKMTETLVKTVEDLKRKGKNLQQAQPEEIRELLEKNHPSL